MSAIFLKTTEVLTVQPHVRRWFDYYTELYDLSETFDFWLAEADEVTLNGSNVATLGSKKTAGGQTLTPSASRQPVWDADHGDGLPSIEFERQPAGAPDSFPITGFPAAAGLSWSKVMLIKAATMNGVGSTLNIFSSPSTGNRHQLRYGYNTDSGDFLSALIGASPNQISLVYPQRPVDEWFLVEQVWDGTTNVAGIALNGGNFIFEDETSAVPGGPDPLAVADATTLDFGALAADGSGQGYDGFARFWGAFNVDISTGHADIRSAVKELARAWGAPI